MPIKLPRGFQRRKSSGNALDEIQDGRETPSSFRVLARPGSTGKSFEKGSDARSMTSKPLPPIKPNLEDEDEDLFPVVRTAATNRGSDGTSNVQYDSAASSSRLSSSSTNPSSVDTRSDKNVRPVARQSYDDIPTPPPHTHKGGFLKNASRTFSLGVTRGHGRETSDAPSISFDRSRPSTVQATTRDRAMTASTTTTATPPRLDDRSFSIRDPEDEFGNMFANLARKSSRENLTSQPSTFRSPILTAPPQPISANKGTHIESSPFSWGSRNSRDGLIRSPSPSRMVVQSNSQPPRTQNMQLRSTQEETNFEDNMFTELPTQRSPEVGVRKPQFTSPSRPPPSSSSFLNINFKSQDRTSPTMFTSQFSRKDSSDFEITPLDPSLVASAQLATTYEEDRSSELQPKPNNKIMTPAQFERYKQQKEETRRYNKVFGRADSDDGSGDDYEDEEDDEQERERQAVKQRKKQEAHLAVYRQQMMKVTGDQANLPPRPVTSAGHYQLGNSSQPELSRAESRLSHMNLGGVKPPTDDGDEDEDVPLGILAAHGFPNKNRPPTRLAASSSNPNLRSLVPAPGSTPPAAISGDANRNSLPAFARNLPPDPYYGAGLVQQSERTSLAMHASPSQSHLAAQPQSSGAATSHPLHPAGLVGVIAGEERARAMRRGSPNAQGGYDMLPMAPPQRPPQQMPGHPGMPMMPLQPMSPAEQAQLQMSQSMQQMMQMQMQWMQQMSSMIGQQPTMPMFQGMPTPPGMQMPQINIDPSSPAPSQNGQTISRPQSVPLQNYPTPNQQRMSKLSPSMAAWNQSSPAVPQIYQNGSVYAPSIAPSERSNVGLAPRYRPVSTMNMSTEHADKWAKRASTFTSFSSRPWQSENTNIRTTIRNVHPGDEDDDEEGWAAMKARKDKKQQSRKLRKGTDSSLQELFNAPI